ncbi:MAG: ABC transporter ATP-binding protein/permease [Lachnospiraceae bacterium]|nr:ABC transporter ATP-binding protein/permease [Lachnospiraceae bacterium]MCM1240074.1 ABC transporter ATP-binding protein/permease [Lachnospiraceae bacterium]MCM1303818.1 ABC transporter ATP-binding protein/permease [Butyrivibrio sp.]MCM1342860.1 ABC transporter ATP-binding protein/permease [Muribaculaceae bacterium]MCM1410487.1 ABC transporter ATP-binding protein/permease [Lachnospiraceae bacterium]
MAEKEKLLTFYIRRIKEGRLRELIAQTAWLYSYVRRYRKSIIAYTLIGLTGTAVSLISSIISKNMVDIITGHQTGGLVRTFCLFISVTIGTILINQLSNYVSGIISLHVDTDMKADVFDKMLITDLEAFTSYHTGDLMTRWNTDVSVISKGILNWIPDLVIFSVKFISAFAVIIYYDPTFALLAMMGIPVGIIMSRSVLKRIQDNNKEAAAMNARMSGFNQEAFSNIQTIKAFDLLRAYSLRLRQYQQEYRQMRSTYLRLSMLTSLIMSIVGVAISYSCYALGIYRVWSGAISYGTMTLFLSLANTLTSTLNSLISLVPTAISITTSASRLMDILAMPKEDFSMRDKISDFYSRHIQEGLSVKLQDITYSYHTGKTVFKNISFEAHPHQITALVGPSGEGKTTMLRIILSLLKPQSGNVTITAGFSGRESIPSSPAVRQLFSYVPQGNTMFSGTIADNMRIVKPDASDEDIVRVLRSACAWDFVSALPDGINSKIGERGHGFSEGQAQRLAIARALLRNSPILLLDEATSALDVATERRILKNILKDTYPRTCIITTHRPTVLTMCDYVYSISSRQCRLLSGVGVEELIRQF